MSKIHRYDNTHEAHGLRHMWMHWNSTNCNCNCDDDCKHELTHSISSRRILSHAEWLAAWRYETGAWDSSWLMCNGWDSVQHNCVHDVMLLLFIILLCDVHLGCLDAWDGWCSCCWNQICISRPTTRFSYTLSDWVSPGCVCVCMWDCVYVCACYACRQIESHALHMFGCTWPCACQTYQHGYMHDWCSDMHIWRISKLSKMVPMLWNVQSDLLMEQVMCMKCCILYVVMHAVRCGMDVCFLVSWPIGMVTSKMHLCSYARPPWCCCYCFCFYLSASLCSLC